MVAEQVLKDDFSFYVLVCLFVTLIFMLCYRKLYQKRYRSLLFYRFSRRSSRRSRHKMQKAAFGQLHVLDNPPPNGENPSEGVGSIALCTPSYNARPIPRSKYTFR
jgi:hypothetical protein